MSGMIHTLSREEMHLCDMYIRMTIRNAATYAGRKKTGQKARAEMVDLDQAHELAEQGDPYEEITDTAIHSGPFTVPIKDERLYKAILSLSEKQCQVFIASVLHNIPIRKIAAHLGLSESMVKRHKMNALKKLRWHLTGKGEAWDYD